MELKDSDELVPWFELVSMAEQHKLNRAGSLWTAILDRLDDGRAENRDGPAVAVVHSGLLLTLNGVQPHQGHNIRWSYVCFEFRNDLEVRRHTPYAHADGDRPLVPPSNACAVIVAVSKPSSCAVTV